MSPRGLGDPCTHRVPAALVPVTLGACRSAKAQLRTGLRVQAQTIWDHHPHLLLADVSTGLLLMKLAWQGPCWEGEGGWGRGRKVEGKRSS